MTVKELIAELQKVENQEAIVCISDSEYGTDPMTGQITKTTQTIWEGATMKEVEAVVIG